MTLDSVLAGAFGGAASGVIVAWVNHLLSRKQFVSERWWERRAEAYAKVVEHLAEIRLALRDSIDELEGLERAVQGKNHIERWETAEAKLALIVHQETFFLSSQALDCLAAIQRELRKGYENVPQPEGFLPFLTATALVFKRGTEDFAQLAREDLEVGKR